MRVIVSDSKNSVRILRRITEGLQIRDYSGETAKIRSSETCFASRASSATPLWTSSATPASACFATFMAQNDHGDSVHRRKEDVR
jgi:hypothetical protein